QPLLQVAKFRSNRSSVHLFTDQYPSLTYSSSRFFFNDTATTEIYTLSLHDALPIYTYLTDHLAGATAGLNLAQLAAAEHQQDERSEEHTSELQSRRDLVCRLLLEKKKRTTTSRPADPSRHANRCYQYCILGATTQCT